jgi:hypothetical protein
VSVDDADIADIAVVENEVEVGTTEGAVDASNRSSRSCANRSSRARNRCWEERLPCELGVSAVGSVPRLCFDPSLCAIYTIYT